MRRSLWRTEQQSAKELTAPVTFRYTCSRGVARTQTLTISVHYLDKVVSKATLTAINKTQKCFSWENGKIKIKINGT